MIYRDFKGLKLSGLGMGNMRLPVIDGDDSRIDFDRASALIRRAYSNRAQLKKKARDEQEARKRAATTRQQEAVLTRRQVARQLLNLQHSTLDSNGLRAYLCDLKRSVCGVCCDGCQEANPSSTTAPREATTSTTT